MRIFLEKSKTKHTRNTGNCSRKTVFFPLDYYLYFIIYICSLKWNTEFEKK